MKAHLTNTNNPIDFPDCKNTEERSLAAEITEGFEALKRVRELEAHNAELKAYNTTLHGIEHDLEMKVSKLQAENELLKDKLMLAKQSLEIVEGWIRK